MTIRIVSRLAAVAAVAVVAALLGGCGKASAGSGGVPAGFARYRGDGFSTAVPTGFEARPPDIARATGRFVGQDADLRRSLTR